MAITKYVETINGRNIKSDYLAKYNNCAKRNCFVPFTGNGMKICRLYELGACKEIKESKYGHNKSNSRT